ncbi:hypothetical protein BH23ACT3_BH23ACT3_06030 [soil metagenome]
MHRTIANMAELFEHTGDDTGDTARHHWDDVWATRRANELSWHQPNAEP